MVSIGTIVWLSSELMFFAALFAMYFTLRAVNPEVWAADTQVLNIPFASVNTTILVLSSVTCQLGVFAAERGDVKGLRRWFIITFLMGAVFIGGQVFEYAELVHYRSHPVLERLRLGLLPHDRLPRPARDRGADRLPLRLGDYLRGPALHHDQATRAIVVSYYWYFVDSSGSPFSS
jgi:Heme/copper-type cytochrome/quinol oxidase, subunit 3